MDAERRRQIEQLFDTALDCPTDAREEWLAVACADDLERPARPRHRCLRGREQIREAQPGRRQPHDR